MRKWVVVVSGSEGLPDVYGPYTEAQAKVTAGDVAGGLADDLGMEPEGPVDQAYTISSGEEEVLTVQWKQIHHYD